MRLNQDPPWNRFAAPAAAKYRLKPGCQEFLECTTCVSDRLGFGTECAVEQCGVVILDGQNAARLAGDDWAALARPIIKLFNIMARVGDGLIEYAVGDERPAAAPEYRITEGNRACRALE